MNTEQETEGVVRHLQHRPLILIVDDEEEMLGLLGSEFQDAGMDVLTARSVKDALKVLRDHRVDVILTDVRMPEASGIQFFNQFESSGGRRPHFIFMSAFTDLEAAEAYDLGVNGILSKPFQTQKAIEYIQYLLGPRLWNWSLPYQGKLPVHKIELKSKMKNKLEPTEGFRLGQGGFFVALPPELIPPSRELVSFRIDFDGKDIPAFQGIGKIRWIRSRSSAQYPSGCGVEILHLIESSRQQMIQYLENFSPHSIIPAA